MVTTSVLLGVLDGLGVGRVVLTAETSYPLYDALGSTRAVTDENGDVTDTFVYDAWGNVLDRTGTTELPFQYVGRHGYYHDAETGLSYVMARIYNPRIVRWLSVDPARLLAVVAASSSAPFSYAQNNPSSMYDWSGLYAFFMSSTDEEKNGALTAVEKAFLKNCKCGVTEIKEG